MNTRNADALLAIIAAALAIALAPWWVPHFATCPQAAGWRAGRSEASGAPGDAEA